MGRLLLLLLWVRRRRQSTLTNLPREYRAESSIIPRVADLRRRLSGTDVLGRVHGARRASAAFQLPAQHGNLVLVPSDSTGQPVVFGYQRVRQGNSLLLQRELSLLHLVDLLTDQLHLLYLIPNYCKRLASSSNWDTRRQGADRAPIDDGWDAQVGAQESLL